MDIYIHIEEREREYRQQTALACVAHSRLLDKRAIDYEPYIHIRLCLKARYKYMYIQINKSSNTH